MSSEVETRSTNRSAGRPSTSLGTAGSGGLTPARILALAVPAALLAGALGSQHLGGLHPCEICYWQRWPHEVAIALALLAFALADRPVVRWLVVAAGLAIVVSGAIGLFHAGVEYHWWQGLTRCTATAVGGSHADILREIMAAPLIRCDEPQWTLFGVSLAGWNALLSLGFGGWILWLTIRSAR